MKPCPKCQVQHSDQAAACDCGYRFSTGDVTKDDQAAGRSNPATKGLIWIITIALAVVAGSIGRQAATGFGDGQSIEEFLPELAAEMNSDLPNNIDNETRIDRVSAGPGKRLTYHYTLLTLPSSSVTAAQLRNAMSDELTDDYCTAEYMSKFRENGVALTYRYSGSDGIAIGEIRVRPENCR